MDPKTKELVDAAEARANAALPGPWRCRAIDEAMSAVRYGAWSVCSDVPTNTAPFIAHARSDIPALCAIVREQDAEIERLRELLQNVCDLDSLHDLPAMMPAIKRALAKPT